VIVVDTNILACASIEGPQTEPALRVLRLIRIGVSRYAHGPRAIRFDLQSA
jgi:hypothetical protein